MLRLAALFLAAATVAGISIAAGTSAVADPRYAQYYPPPGYGYPPSPPPPCQAVTPGPFQGAARGAAGGALIGAISGNAGRGAAIGAGFGAVRSAVRRGSARSAGTCY
jgi:hypothetical protein